MAAPGLKTLAQLRASAKTRADMVKSKFVSDDEWLDFINGSALELYDLLVEKGEVYFIADPFVITTDGVAERFPLPDGTGQPPAFYKLLGVDLRVAGSTEWRTLKPFSFAERNRFATTSVPRAGQSVQVHYVPRLSPLEADEDTLDGVSGWEEIVVVDAARKALLKEEADVSALIAEKAGLIKRIEDAAANRDQGMPATVADVYTNVEPAMRYRLVGNQLWLRSIGSPLGSGYPEPY